MRTGYILPDLVLGSLLTLYRCRRCQRSYPTLTVQDVLIGRRPTNEVELIYRVRCGCGRVGALNVRLPFLLFGFILAWTEVVNNRRPRAQKPRPIAVGGPEFYRKLVTEYSQMLSRKLPAGAEPLVDTDRQLLQFTDETWQDFLRRMNGPEQEKTSDE